MRVGIVNLAFDPSLPSPEALLDAYHSLTGWSEAIRDAGVSVTVVQAYSRDALVQRHGIDYRFLRLSAPALLRDDGLRDAVLSAHPDLVHVNGLDVPLQTWWLRRALPAPVALVVQDHASVPGRNLSMKAPIRRRAMAAPDAYLFTAREQAVSWIERGFIREDGLVHELLEASTTLAPIDRDLARDQTGTGGAPSVLWVGRLTANKDPLCVLDGFDMACRDLPDARLTMVFSDEALLPAVRRRVGDSAVLSARVRLVGALPRAGIAAWFSAADIFVLGSHREGSGYAALEACACGAVPVLTDIPPFRAITGGGAVGQLWRPGDPAALAAALVRTARVDLGRQREQVLQHFDRSLSWAAVGRQAVSVYRRVLEARRRTQAG